MAVNTHTHTVTRFSYGHAHTNTPPSGTHHPSTGLWIYPLPKPALTVMSNVLIRQDESCIQPSGVNNENYFAEIAEQMCHFNENPQLGSALLSPLADEIIIPVADPSFGSVKRKGVKERDSFNDVCRVAANLNLLSGSSYDLCSVNENCTLCCNGFFWPFWKLHLSANSKISHKAELEFSIASGNSPSISADDPLSLLRTSSVYSSSVILTVCSFGVDGIWQGHNGESARVYRLFVGRWPDVALKRPNKIIVGDETMASAVTLARVVLTNVLQACTLPSVESHFPDVVLSWHFAYEAHVCRVDERKYPEVFIVISNMVMEARVCNKEEVQSVCSVGLSVIILSDIVLKLQINMSGYTAGKQADLYILPNPILSTKRMVVKRDRIFPLGARPKLSSAPPAAAAASVRGEKAVQCLKAQSALVKVRINTISPHSPDVRLILTDLPPRAEGAWRDLSVAVLWIVDNRPKGKKRSAKENARKKRAGIRTGVESTRSQTGEDLLIDVKCGIVVSVVFMLSGGKLAALFATRSTLNFRATNLNHLLTPKRKHALKNKPQLQTMSCAVGC
ncbi:hypothetical protein E1301_Tti000347 [Triplophysa tibetana]|uniref:Uncharacterized protein n=1 Tax=Triplophysa tibetana TaxID=1572043 RepID=A0A5A9N4U1_9TELE|nr:hypothetical protein E1301_Tti000347 [Triplophysa tibetana]